ncbi:hypothetical protein C8F04DRAFT_1257958 [Mycena alexandri]|nr:hypothetical protein C8F04DRAFT_1257958 [Mycena alexandri]
MPDVSTQTDPALPAADDLKFKREAIDWVEGKLAGPPSAEMLRWLGVNIVPQPEKKAAIAAANAAAAAATAAPSAAPPRLRSAADKTTADYINPLSEKDLQNLEHVRKAALEELVRL